jgi:hypothetical protein
MIVTRKRSKGGRRMEWYEIAGVALMVSAAYFVGVVLGIREARKEGKK